MADQKSYQELKQELDRVMAELQHEDTDIEQAIVLHKQATELLKQLERYLANVAKDAKLDIKLKKTA